MIKKGVFQIGGALLIFVWKKDYKAITKPMTTTELYKKVCGILKKQGKMPDILDYGLPAYHPVPITKYKFDLKSNLNYGGSEGIYLDLWIEFCSDSKKCVNDLGTFKTLNRENEAMHIMAALLADSD